jgi:hypothetical protein
MNRDEKRKALAKLHELAPHLASPTFADALELLCHCGEKLDADCKCNAAKGATEH